MSDNAALIFALYSRLTDVWRRSNLASPADGIECLLEMLAFHRLSGTGDMPDFNAELTEKSWQRVRDCLTEQLRLPAPATSYSAISSPALAEEIRRIVGDATAEMDEGEEVDFMSPLLDFLAFAPQTGLRRTEIGQSKFSETLPNLFLELIEATPSSTHYIPFDSSSWLPLLMARNGCNVFCELQSAQSARISALFASLAKWPLDVRQADPLSRPSYLEGDRLRRFDYAVAVLSFGLRSKNDPDRDIFGRFPMRLLYGEARQLAHLLAQADKQVLAIAPEGLLVRTTGGERDYKEHLVRHGVLSAVLRLPRSTFSPQANIQTSLLILDARGRPQNDVLFVDASGILGNRLVLSKSQQECRSQEISEVVRGRKVSDISVVATYEDIAANNFNISVDRYIISDDERKVAHMLSSAQAVELGDIAEVIRPQSIPSDATDEGVSFAEVGLQDIQPDGSISDPAKHIEIDGHRLAKARRQQLQPGDVLLSARGRIGTVAIVPETIDKSGSKGWLASQAFVILRPRATSPLTVTALYRYLSSPLGQTLLSSVASGATVQMVSIGDIKKLRVMVPSREAQARIAAEQEHIEALHAQIKSLEREVELATATAWPMSPDEHADFAEPQ